MWEIIHITHTNKFSFVKAFYIILVLLTGTVSRDLRAPVFFQMVKTLKSRKTGLKSS